MPGGVVAHDLEALLSVGLLAREVGAALSCLGERGLGLRDRRSLRLEIAARRGHVAARGRHALRDPEPLAHGGEGRLGRGLGLPAPAKLSLPRLERLRRRVLVVTRELGGDEVGLAPRVGRSAVGDLLHLDVDVEVQQRDQDLVALLRLALQEGVELPLRQHHRAGEGIVVETHDLLDLVLDVLHPPRERLEALRRLLLEHGLGVAREARGAGHPVATPADFEVELDGEPLGPVADELLVLATHPRHLAVEAEDDGVDERRLAGAGGPGDGEEVEAVEVEKGALLEGGEALELQPQGPHPCASS